MPTPKTYKYSAAIWPLLTAAALNQMPYTYESLAKALGMRGPMDAWRMAKLLDPIADYCDQNGLPPLTAMVVNQETRLPGDGLKPGGKYKNKDMNWVMDQVFEEDWHAIAAPNAYDFEDAANRE